MNKLTIIGNLTKDPELRTTTTGINVCTFTLAVNKRGQEEETDYFKVTAWRQLGENCAKFLQKGRKACVIGPVSLHTYTGQDGKTYANMEVLAQDVEFVSPRVSDQDAADRFDREIRKEAKEQKRMMNDMIYDDDLPF